MSVRADDTPVALIRPMPESRRVRHRRAGRRRGGVWRWAFRVGALVVAVGLVYFAVSLYQVWSTGRGDQAQPVDAIVVMGAAQYDGEPSPSSPPGSTTSSSCGRRRSPRSSSSRAATVPATASPRPRRRPPTSPSAACRRTPSCSRTGARRATSRCTARRELLRQRDLDDVLIVTDPYHALRSRLIAEELGLRAHVSPTPTSVVTGGEQFVRQLEEAAGVAVGRLLGFDRI